VPAALSSEPTSSALQVCAQPRLRSCVSCSFVSAVIDRCASAVSSDCDLERVDDVLGLVLSMREKLASTERTLATLMYCYRRQRAARTVRVQACLRTLYFAAVRCNNERRHLQHVSVSRSSLQLVEPDF